MIVLKVRNVHEALPLGLALLRSEGVERASRNGPVLIGPSVTTIYERPNERVLFWPERDANPFFHLYESLWMLAGRNDIFPLTKYAKNIANYSDDGKTSHGAYGYRWRQMCFFSWRDADEKIHYVRDQLPIIAARLRKDPDDRRCVLQMWAAEVDLGKPYKDVPCNVTATFQRGNRGELNLVVFCRSNDIIWGAYGANAVHFSFLLEYMALWIGCPVGTYTQISVNWHAYLGVLNQLHIPASAHSSNPYADKDVRPAQMFHGSIEDADTRIASVLFHADTGFAHVPRYGDDEPFFNAAYLLLKAHQLWRITVGPDRYKKTLEVLSLGDQRNDWIVAGTEWIQRRQKGYEEKHGN